MDELISRKAIEKLKKYRLSYDTNTTIPKSGIFVKISDLKDLPSVTPQRPKGKWVEDEDCLDGINFPDVRFYCSECESMVYRKSVYCPNCGADMRGEEE